MLKLPPRLPRPVVVAVLTLAMFVPVARLRGQVVDSRTMETMLSDQLAAMARMATAGPIDPEAAEDAFKLSEILADLALDTNPSDSELWMLRRQIAAQRRADDPDNDTLQDDERKALREYVKLIDKKSKSDSSVRMDDVALANLLVLNLSEENTMQARVDKIKNLLNSDTGQGLSKALQSRLSSYVAASATQTGDGEVDKAWLRHAMKLDATNYDAARMTFELVARRESSTPQEMALAIYGLLRANPVDPDTHVLLARLLISQGAYREAATQFRVFSEFYPEMPPEDFFFNYAFCLAASGQQAEAVGLLEQYKSGVEMLKRQAEEAKKAREAASVNEFGVPLPPEEVPEFGPEIEVPEISPKLTILDYCIRLEDGQLGGFGRGPLEEVRSKLQAAADAGDKELESFLTWFLVWFNFDQPDIDRRIERLAEEVGESSPLVVRTRGWRALHKGDNAKALELLRPIAKDDADAAYGVALLSGSPDSTARQRRMQEVIEVEPSGFSALLAARELFSVKSRPRPTTAGGEIQKMMDRWEFQLIRPEPQTRPWIAVDVEVEPALAGYLDPIEVKITVRNMTDIPLALGERGAVPARMFLYVSARRAGRSMGQIAPLVVDLNRRIRLEARESIETTVRLDRSPFAGVLWNLATERITYSVTGLLDPRFAPNGQVVTGPLGGSDTADVLEVGGYRPDVTVVKRWTRMLDEPDRVARAKAMASLIAAVPGILVELEPPPVLDDEDTGPVIPEPEKTEEQIAAELELEVVAQKAVDAINRVYPSLDSASQAWTVLFLPEVPQYRQAPYEDEDAFRRRKKYAQDQLGLFDRVTSLAKRSDNPAVRIAYIQNQIYDPQSPEMTDSLRHPNDTISEVARIRTASLERTRAAREKMEAELSARTGTLPEK